MAVLVSSSLPQLPWRLHSSAPILSPTHRYPHRSWGSPSPTQTRSSSAMRALHMDFPYLSPPHRGLMADLLSSLDDRLGPQLLPPSDSLHFHNDSGSSKGALHIVPGAPSSSVDFLLESWIHCELPFGTLNITTLFAFLKSTATDAPHLLMEFIQSGPASLVLIIDLLPRKDLVLDPAYLDRFYQQTQLDKPRQDLDKCPQVKPYCSSSLYIRSVLSPTAIAVNINCEAGEMDEIISFHVGGAAREVVRIWLERCVGEQSEVGEEEKAVLERRDALIKKKAIEVDLTANLPRLFGQDVANRVVEIIQRAFGV